MMTGYFKSILPVTNELVLRPLFSGALDPTAKETCHDVKRNSAKNPKASK
jgi:hypothetical protein